MRNVLITGAGSGLGKEIGLYLLKKGFNLYVIDRLKKDEIDGEYFKKIKKYYEYDLVEIQEIINQLTKDDARIDVLINNASIRLFKNFTDFTDSELQTYINVNLISHLKLTKFLIQNFDSCKIIWISSRAAFSGYSTGSMYCASKAFIHRISEAIAKECASKKITSNLICPSALARLDGSKEKNYENQIRRILKYIDIIINENVSGKCFNTFSLIEKTYFMIKTFKNLT